eukprot:jgi/Tetstr1/430653/TSEL_020446.t1
MMASFDLADGNHTLGINEADRVFFTMVYRGTLHQLAVLPRGWLIEVFVRHLRAPEPPASLDRVGRPSPARPTLPKRLTRRYLRNTRWKGARLLLYMDDFLFFVESERAALALRDRVAALVDWLGRYRNSYKGSWRPVQVCEHPNLTIDTVRGEFRVPEAKLLAALP